MLSGIEMITIPELVSQALGSFLISETALTGLRLAMKHPERVTAIVTQNGNAYLDAFEHLATLYRDWRIPMYNLDFSLIPVTLEELEAAQEREYWSMVGDPRW
jgi:pimeloyl-ACP methyl ester carboxylesterase